MVYQLSNGRADKISEKECIMMKECAEKLGIPIIITSCLNREPEYRKDHRPIITDISKGSYIVDYADKIIFLYRDDYYNPNSEKRNIMDVIVAKDSTGSIGIIELIWLGNYAKFANIERYRE